MKPLFVIAPIALGIMIASLSTAEEHGRHVPCKIEANAKSCYWTHGRLQLHNGTPSFRLLKIGTNRLLGVYSGPSVDRVNSLDNENPEFPTNVQKSFRPFQNRIFGDFEVCPLEPERSGVMQAVCIEAAKNIVVEDSSWR